MNVDEYFERLQDRFSAAVETAAERTAQDTRQQMRDHLPSNRQETRRAVRYVIERRGDQTTIRVGLHFQQRFGRIQHTETARIYYAAWRNVKPKMLVMLRAHIRDQLKSI